MFETLGRLAFTRRRAVLAGSALVLVLSAVAIARGGRLSTGETRGTEADQAQRWLDRELGLPGTSSFTIIFSSEHMDLDDPRFFQAMGRALAPLRRDPRVASVMAADTAPDVVAAHLESTDYHHALAIVTLEHEYREAAREYPELRAAVRPGPLEATFTGHLAFRSDLDRTLQEDLLVAEAISLPLALLVLLVVFRTGVAACLPVGVGGLAVASGIACVMALSHVADMAVYAINVASLIGLGVAIDYSLFIVSRYRAALGEGKSYEDALVEAVSTAGRAVAFSGLAVGVGLSGLLFFQGSFLATMGLAGAIVVLLAIVFALTFLPALLAVLGPRIHAGRMPLGRVGSRFGGGWQRVARWVMKHPVLVLAPTLAFLVTLGAPFLELRMAQVDVTVLPAEAEARRGWELLREQFPEQAANRIFVAVRFGGSPLEASRARSLYELSQRVRAMPGVIDVQSFFDLGPMFDRDSTVAVVRTPYDQLSPELQVLRDTLVGGRTAVLVVLTEAAPSSDAARDLVRALRASRRVADGLLLVAGRTADDVDVTAFILARAPAAVAFVVVMTYVVLFVLLRSVLLPLKAIVMNVLSIAASFGALVWIFQEGHLASVLHFEPGPIDPTLPVLLFCTVFGLSMDYEVLMLTRMQEEYRGHRDNLRAVADGLERTGPLVTSAAAIMVTVFLAFALAAVLVVKATGIGMALAVAVDATLVRVLVVPATMRLFGDLNWWCPRWLRWGASPSSSAPRGR